MTGIESIRIDWTDEQAEQTQSVNAIGSWMGELEERITPVSMVEYALLLVAVLLLA